MTGPQRRRWFMLAAAPIAAIGLFAWRTNDVQRYRTSLANASVDVDEGRYALAASKLASFTAAWPRSDEGWFLLGTCEAARGRADSAVADWSRIPPDSPFAPRAIQGRLQLEAGAGRLARAEALILEALADPRIDGASLPILLSPIYCQEGRLEETLQLLEARWKALEARGKGASEAAINLVRTHADLRLTPIPIEATRTVLATAASLAPDDDRVWLGKANLAIEERSLDDARRWLDSCLQRRPDDPPVWRSRLRWAMASGRTDEVERALEQLPAEGMTPAQIRRIVAWRAGRRGDLGRERRAFERLLVVDPGDTVAMERLADLAAKAGDSSAAGELHGRKAAADRRRERYRVLQARAQPLRDAEELASLAAVLGEWFEARGYLELAQALDERRGGLADVEAALNTAPKPLGPSAGTLAAAVAAEESELDASRRRNSQDQG